MAIHRSIKEGRLDAKIKIIISNKSNAAGLAYAREASLPSLLIERKPGENRTDFDKRISQALDEAGVDIICLAGFMRLLSKEFIARYRNKIVNIHPSLLPNFSGLDAQKQAVDAGAKVSGCTVHFVDEGCDTGPVIAQREVPVLPEDTEDSLADRILEQEHKLYSECLQKIAEGKVQIEGRNVRVF